MDSLVPAATSTFRAFEENKVGWRLDEVSMDISTFDYFDMIFRFSCLSEEPLAISSNKAAIDCCHRLERHRILFQAVDQVCIVLIEQNVPNTSWNLQKGRLASS